MVLVDGGRGLIVRRVIWDPRIWKCIQRSHGVCNAVVSFEISIRLHVHNVAAVAAVAVVVLVQKLQVTLWLTCAGCAHASTLARPRYWHDSSVRRTSAANEAATAAA